MSVFEEAAISFHDQAGGRHVTVTLNKMKLPSARVSFADPEQPDETNSQERARVLAKAKALFQQAAASF